MSVARQCRLIAFAIMLASTFLAMQSGVLAMWGNLSSFASAWSQYGCSFTPDQGFQPAIYATGECDFSSSGDPEEYGNEYCNAYLPACSNDCMYQYPDYLADWYANVENPNDPCWSAHTEPSCWVAWPSGGCSAGAQSSWTCQCGAINICECG